MRRLVIAVDCDDVLVPTAEKVIAYYNRTYGATVTSALFYSPIDPMIWGVASVEEASVRIEQYLLTHTDEMLEPFTEAVAAIKRLAEHHELHIVTSRSKALEPLTQHMVARYFDGVFASIEHVHSYAPLTHGAVRRTKGEVCRQIGAHLLIDDHFKHGHDARRSGVEEVILFGSYDWNIAERDTGNFRYCPDWSTTVEEVERIAYA